MRKRICISVSALVFVILIVFFHPVGGGKTQGEAVFLSVLPSLFSKEDPAAEETAHNDTMLRVYLTKEQRMEEMELEAYVAGVVLSEMPESYDFEALKAQAVAARTYAVYKSHLYSGEGCARHPEADVCASSGCCQGFETGESEIAARAAQETAGEIAVFRGKPIRALYHASAGGHTEDAENVYSEALAYLRGVPSPGEESYGQYSAETRMTIDEIAKAFEDHDDILILKSLPLSDQFEILLRSETGRVLEIRVGLTSFQGNDFRRIMGLKSSNFEMEFEDTAITFKTIGYGHGVGLSQTGADAMAQRGAGYREILSWYYSGAEVRNMPEVFAEIQNSTEI